MKRATALLAVRLALLASLFLFSLVAGTAIALCLHGCAPAAAPSPAIPCAGPAVCPDGMYCAYMFHVCKTDDGETDDPLGTPQSRDGGP